MPTSPSMTLRWVYCLAIVSTILPLGVSGWVTMTVGSSGFGSVPFAGPLIMLALGVLRIFQVATDRERLDTFEVTGFNRVLRVIGVIAMSVGVLYLILQLGYRPLVSKLITQRTESGVEFYLVGVYIALLSGAGGLGIVLFEASRLFGFESRMKKV